MANARSNTPPPHNEAVLSYAPGTSERSALVTELKLQGQTEQKIPLVIGSDKIFASSVAQAVVSPHRHAHRLASYTPATAEHVQAAIANGLAARKEWAALDWEDRAAVFLKAAELLAGKYRAVINAATMLGQSKTCHQAEIDASCELIDFFRFNVAFAERIYSEQPQSARGIWNRSEVRGLEGFIYAIAPFNFTSIAVNLPAAPALMGCSVLWKPAPTSLLSAWVGMQILEEAGLPPGVINMVVGDPAIISSVALAHPELSGIHFTGSTTVFNMLWKTVGQNIDHYKSYPRLVGETGGKDFVFAHPSAGVQELVTGLIRGAFEFQGQKCSAASRAYIPQSLWPAVKEGLLHAAEQIKVGDPSDFTNFMGAVIDQKAFTKIKSYIDHAQQSSDARIIFGGQCDSSVGYFIQPTIIEALDPHYRSMKEEIFGPVLSVYVYDDAKLEETLVLCDTATPYALTGAIYAKDRRVIAQLTKALQHSAGNFYINDKPTGAVVGQQPFGGSRASGTNDKAGSIWNLLRWCSHRTIKENFHPITDFRYPYMQN